MTTKQATKRILQYARPYRHHAVSSVFFNFLYSLFSVVSVGSLLPLLQILFGLEDVGKLANEARKKAENSTQIINFDRLKASMYESMDFYLTEYGGLHVLTFICILVAILFFFRNIFRYLGQYYLVGFRTGAVKDLRLALYQKITALPVSYFSEQRKGDVLNRFSSDVSEVQRFVLMPFIEIFRAPIMLLVTLAALISMNATLTLAAFLILPVMGFVISMISKSLKRDAQQSQEKLSELLSYLDETLNAIKIVKIFNAEKLLNNRFVNTSVDWRRFVSRTERKTELSSPISEFLGSVTLMMLVWVGGSLILSQKSTFNGADFLVFIALFFQILDPAKMLSKSISDLSRGGASARRLLEIIDTDLEVHESKSARTISEFKKAIEFKNINFSYGKDKSVVQDFSLTIPKGKTVALVGQSGSGKSTITSLLSRFWDVNSGDILIDGTPLKELKLDSFRALIGMVTQDSVLFNDSVFNNIALSKPDATEAEVRNAAKIANAEEFILKLENGYQTNIGEGGSKLSGGQKQRLSIARAVLKNPPIMVLDEATSALDSHSEKMVQSALEEMMKNRTSLVIAHRLSTIKNADEIVVMHEGKIIEKGSHDALMKLGGHYAKLIEMQNFE